MAKQSLIWTALPNGLTDDGKSARVSVLLSPRLTPENDAPELGSFFPDWKDWPATLTKATFEVRYGSAVISIPANVTTGRNRVDTLLGAPDSQAWKALFKKDLFVKGFEFVDLSGNLVLSFDASFLSSTIRHLYGKMATNAVDRLPVVSDFAEDTDWAHLVSTVMQLDRHFMDRKTGLRDVSGSFARFYEDRLAHDDKLIETLARFQLFHTPPAKPEPTTHVRTDDARIKTEWMQFEKTKMPKPEELAKKLDFHQIVAAMNSYPAIMRRLGLVVDLVIDSSLLPKSQDDLLSVSVKFAPGALQVQKTPDASPHTHTIFSSSRFQAVSNPTPQPDALHVSHGLLDISPNRYDLLQADIDGAGLKIVNFARTLARIFPDHLRSDTVSRFEKELGVPALRNAGLMLVQRNRWSMLSGKFAASKDLDEATKDVFAGKPNAMPPSLWAEDIIRGFRIDIWDSVTELWRSLCERSAIYRLGDSVGEINLPREEATVRLAATKSADINTNKDLVYLHESLVSWTGWSLGAPPPGRVIMPDDSVDENSTQTDAELPPGLKFQSSFKPVKGSLPRLRYGRRYWIRARVVDLAGNSALPQEKDFGPEHPEENARLYCRYDPVTPPVIALVRPAGMPTERPAEGESMERIAIRTFNDLPSDNKVPTGQIAHRYAVPPQSTVREAELHGMLDSGGVLDKSKFDMLANQKDMDAKGPDASLQEEIIATKGPLDAAPVDTTFAVYREGEDLTYLPDPMAVEVAARIFDHPGISDSEIIRIPLYNDRKWPDAQPFKVRVFEDPNMTPKYDSAAHTLLIPLSKAVRAKIRLSMCLSKDSLVKLGIWNWVFSADDKLTRMAIDGQHWMLTPWRTLEVVHAVQKPLISPQLYKLTVQRAYSWTFARPSFYAICSIKSTDRLDLLSEWHEPKDEPAGESGEKQVDLQRGDVGFSIKVADSKMYALKIQGEKYGGFSDHMIMGEDLISVNVMHDLVPPKTHEFHDTRYKRIEYWLDATTRFREYMPGSILTEIVGNDIIPTEKNIKVSGPRTVTWIPSSAPPPAPSILYVVPTFGWTRTSDGKGNKHSMRRGRGLRVYLDRPWNVSGYGEMLAVVLPPETFSGDPDDEPKGNPYKNYITQWGNDPIWLSPFVFGMSPRRSNFLLARTAADAEGKWLPEGAPTSEKDQPPGPFAVTGLTPPGKFSYLNTVDVAPHDVFYDKDRRLWYCDIEINQGSSYYPFIRLALARYQPVSVHGAHLSNIVLADFMPLASDRWLNLTRTGNEKVRKLAIYGPRYTDSSGHLEAASSPSMSMIDPFTRKTRRMAPAEVSKTTVFDVWIEKLDKNLGEDFGWHKIAQVPSKPAPSKKLAVHTAHDKARAGELVRARKFDILISEGLVEVIYAIQPLWEGDVTLPPMQGERHRLVVAEYEEYIIDDDRPYDKVPEKKGKRLVFVEHVELD